jgi:hypothetical protein
MDKKALFELEMAIKRALSQYEMQAKPVVCRICSNEMEVQRRCIICRYCGIIHWVGRKELNSESGRNQIERRW